ncbi:MAG: ATP-binding cassette domain-containing protein [Vicingaceae bacterium]
MSFLSVNQVSKQYDDHIALSEVSFEVPRKSIFGLLGPNGAGKTSLIRIINRITAPDSGMVSLKGKDLSLTDTSLIGYLPEERGLYKKMKVGEQALYLSMLKGMDKHDAIVELRKWFEKLNLEGWWNKPVEDLSKGMAQKLQFIVTVVHRPKLLILDEPFSGFDPINTRLIKEEILKLNRKGTTVIFSTHNMESVEEICDRIALINKSKKILEGSLGEIKQNFTANKIRLQFKGNMIAFTNAMWTGCELLSSSGEKNINTVEIKLRGEVTKQQMLQAVLPHIELISMNDVVPSMNDIFIEAVDQYNQQGNE